MGNRCDTELIEARQRASAAEARCRDEGEAARKQLAACQAEASQCAARAGACEVQRTRLDWLRVWEPPFANAQAMMRMAVQGNPVYYMQHASFERSAVAWAPPVPNGGRAVATVRVAAPTASPAERAHVLALQIVDLDDRGWFSLKVVAPVDGGYVGVDAATGAVVLHPAPHRWMATARFLFLMLWTQAPGAVPATEYPTAAVVWADAERSALRVAVQTNPNDPKDVPSWMLNDYNRQPTTTNT